MRAFRALVVPAVPGIYYHARQFQAQRANQGILPRTGAFGGLDGFGRARDGAGGPPLGLSGFTAASALGFAGASPLESRDLEGAAAACSGVSRAAPDYSPPEAPALPLPPWAAAPALDAAV